jgi:hypothetical protein
VKYGTLQVSPAQVSLLQRITPFFPQQRTVFVLDLHVQTSSEHSVCKVSQVKISAI